MQPDKKVEEYLERAKAVIIKIYDKPPRNGDMHFTPRISDEVIEIAKMIQLEEHREQIEITPEKDMLSVMRDNLDYHKTFAKHKAEIDEIEMQRNNPYKLRRKRNYD